MLFERSDKFILMLTLLSVFLYISCVSLPYLMAGYRGGVMECLAHSAGKEKKKSLSYDSVHFFQINMTDKHYATVFSAKEAIYLTPDSPNGKLFDILIEYPISSCTNLNSSSSLVQIEM